MHVSSRNQMFHDKMELIPNLRESFSLRLYETGMVQPPLPKSF
jgi:hypothetical protein